MQQVLLSDTAAVREPWQTLHISVSLTAPCLTHSVSRADSPRAVSPMPPALFSDDDDDDVDCQGDQPLNKDTQLFAESFSSREKVVSCAFPGVLQAFPE